MLYYNKMLSSVYVEDYFLLFFDLVKVGKIRLEPLDISPVRNFVDTISDDKALTKSQSNFILRILSKYRAFIINHEIQIDEVLLNPEWKKPFREIDTAKKISLSVDKDQVKYILAKFPFSFKETFFKDFLLDNRSASLWDHEEKVQKVKLLDVNLINFVECAKRHNFYIEQEIIDIVDQLEEFWNDEEQVIPYSKVVNDSVMLFNATESASNFFDANRRNNLSYDLILAKAMGFVLKETPTNKIEAIAAVEENKFWISSVNGLIELTKTIEHYPMVVVLDRASDDKEWARQFVDTYRQSGLPISDIKICYRCSNDNDIGKEFNNWVKDHDLGKNLETGKIFICLHKPPKWMFKENFDAKITVTNAIYPNINNITDSLVESSHLVLFVSEIKPSEKRNKKIVAL